MSLTAVHLDRLFGPATSGESASGRAMLSSRRFIRHLDRIEFAHGESSGRLLSAWEVWNILDEGQLGVLAEEGKVCFARALDVASQTLEARQEELLLSPSTIDKVAPVADAEEIAIARLEQRGMLLSLDERLLGLNSQAGADHALGVRLRSLQGERSGLSQSAVARLSMAAWVARRQNLLIDWLGMRRTSNERRAFEVDTFYGDRHCPAWEHGYTLARQARQVLGIAPAAPITHLRRLIESDLGIPLIQSELPQKVAGATVANGTDRGIVINIRGRNQNVWIRRATLAHELCHYLWDPDEQLQNLIVDEYHTLAANLEDMNSDRVEQRANAFAIEFLAPQDALLDLYEGTHRDPSETLRLTMGRFGISFTAAKNHLANALKRAHLPAFDSGALRVDAQPDDEWNGRESFTDDYFPLSDVPIDRRGLFAAFTMAALQEFLISKSTAAQYLGVTPDTLNGRTVAWISSIYPDLIKEAQRRMAEHRKRIRPDRRRSDIRANHVWLVQNAHRHRGQWLALADGRLVASSEDYETLVERVERAGERLDAVIVTHLGASRAHA
ncbi:MAG: ImmA/IrrE family metallo-endopeptidase [bacterium]